MDNNNNFSNLPLPNQPTQNSSDNQFTTSFSQPLSQTIQSVTIADNNKVPRFKLILYFLIGLITNIIGSVIALIWIVFKVKEHKKPRIIALGAGVLCFFLIQIVLNLLSPIITPKLLSIVNSQFPELKELAGVQTSLSHDFPGDQFSISINKETTSSLKNSSSSTSTIITISANTNDLSKTFSKKVGIRTCQLLAAKKIDSDDVKVTLTKTKTIIPIINFNTYESIDEVHTCNDWQINPHQP